MPRGLDQVLAELRQAGILGDKLFGTDYSLDIHNHLGAGAYICGEESALLESLEGKLGQPRLKPPFPADKGLYQKPTVVNNTETLTNVPMIIARGAAWYKTIGTEKSPGPKIFCLSGNVVRPGNYELPLGTTFRHLIYELGGGVPGGKKVKAILTAGASSTVLTGGDDILDTPMDYESVAAKGGALGSASIIVMDESVDMAWLALKTSRFFKHESCGKCTPCREGTYWMLNILERVNTGEGVKADIDLLQDVAGQIQGKCLCPLGDFAATPGAEQHQAVPGRFRRARQGLQEARAAGLPDRRRRGKAAAAGGRQGRALETPRPTAPLRSGANKLSGTHRQRVMAQLLKLTIDGAEVTVPKGTLIVDAAKTIDNEHPGLLLPPQAEAGGHVPHVPGGNWPPAARPRHRPAGARRPGPAQDRHGPQARDGLHHAGGAGHGGGRRFRSKVKEARDDILEFLLTSHPLDCPICDKGGECPLQNLTIAFGPGKSRFLFDEKFRLAKHVPLGDLIFLDRERCIQCARCTRFQDEVVDDPVIGFYERGRHLEIVTFSEPGFDSKFSGNTTDICPVGALTTADFRFEARPWELNSSASICPHCPVGCNLTLNTRREARSGGETVIKRVMPRQNEQVNEIWICDKGRFGHGFAHSPDRLTTPLVRGANGLEDATWEQALALVAEKFKAAGAGLGALLGDRLSNEDLYAIRKVVTAQGGQVALNSAMGGGDLVQLLGVGAGTNFDAMGAGTAILVVASDLEEEAPIWWLRVKQAAERGATLIVANGRPTKTDRHAAYSLRYRYGDEVGTVLGMLVAGSSEAADAFARAENAVVLYGHEGLDLAGSTALAQACANLLITTGTTAGPTTA